jgi:hypothetical protein
MRQVDILLTSLFFNGGSGNGLFVVEADNVG